MAEFPRNDSKPRKSPWGLRQHDEEIGRLRYEEKMTFQAIADRFGCSKQAIAGALARLAMKKALAATTAEGSTTDTEDSASATALSVMHQSPSAQGGAQPRTEEV